MGKYDLAIEEFAPTKITGAADKPSKYDAAIEEVSRTTGQAATANAIAATRYTPEQAAKVQQLARQSGYPAEAVEGNEAGVMADVLARQNRELLQKDPFLSSIVASNPAFADVAQKDMVNAAAITKAWQKGGFDPASRAARKKQGELEAGLAGVAPALIASPARGTMGELGDALMRGVARAGVSKTMIASELGLYGDAKTELAVQLGQELRNVGAYPMSEDVARGLAEIKEAGNASLGDALLAVAKNPRAVIEVAVESLAVSSPSLALAAAGSMAGPFGTAAGAGIGSFAVEYAATLSEAIGEINDPTAIYDALSDEKKLTEVRTKAVKRGIPIALFDALTAGVAGKILAGAKPTVGSVASRAAGETAVQAVGGGAGEAVAGLVTNEFNWGDVLLEAFAEIPSAIVEVPSNYSHYRALRAAEAMNANADVRRMTELFDLASKSQVRDLDSVTFQSFFQQVSDNQTVLIDAGKLIETLDAAGIPLATLPTAAAEIEKGEVPGVGIEIPVAELVTNLAGTGVENQIVQHLRMDPESPTLAEANAEAEAAATTFMAEADRIVGEAAADEQFATETKQIEDDLTAALGGVRTGWSQTANRTQAQLAAKMYQVMAKRTNVTPAEAFRMAPMTLNGQVIGAPATPAAEGVAADTQITETLREFTTTNYEQAAAEYEALNNEELGLTTEGGFVLNTDLARELSPEYRAARTKSAAVHEPASAFIKRLYADKLSKPTPAGKLPVVLITAGGTGAGKSSGLALPELAAIKESAEMVYDTNMNKLASAVEKIEQALAAGRSVVIAYTHRDPVEALASGALPRAVRMGRTVPIEEHEKTHVGANEVIRQLAEKYKGNDNVRISVIDNARGKGNASVIGLTELPELDTIGLKEKLDATLRQEYEAGRISEAIFRGTERRRTRQDRGQADTGAGQESEQQDVLNQTLPSRWPTSKKATPSVDDPMLADLETLKQDKAQFEKAVAAVAGEPGMKTKARSAEAKSEAVISRIVDNLLWLHDQVPAEIRARSKLWYDGARQIADNWAEKYGKTRSQTAGILAVLSPQKDWFMNVTMAERVLDILSTKMDHKFDAKMKGSAFQFLLKDLQNPEDKRKNTAAYDAVKDKTLREVIEAGRTLEIGIWLRAYDEAHHAAKHRVIHPEGDFGELATTVSGSETLRAWGGFDALGKAATIYLDGRPETINAMLGGEHKVRNFYNNIYEPADPRFTTIDTHAVAAALLAPVAGSDKPVADNFGKTGGTNLTGVSGTYPIYYEAYKRAAEARGILPREMQSITWEAIRGLFTEGFKGKKENLTAVGSIWKQVDGGKLTVDAARAQITEMAGGMQHPDWWGGSELPGAKIGTTYASERAPFVGRKITFEVAPDPTNIELTNRWNALPEDKKLEISHSIAWNIAGKALAFYNSDTIKGELHMQTGGYLEQTNPSLSLWMNKYSSMTKIIELANTLGYALRQDAMMVTSPSKFAGGEKMGAVVVGFNADRVAPDVKALYDEVRAAVPEIDGHTTSDSAMIMLVPLDRAEEIEAKVASHLAGRYQVDRAELFVAWPSKENGNYGFDQSGREVPGSPLREHADNLRREASAAIEAAIGAAEQANQLFQRGSEVRAGAVAGPVTAVHFSKQPRTDLVASFAGTGMKGAEAERLAAADPRIKQRLNFYVSTGQGVFPESDVGSQAHVVSLDNLYDADADALKLFRKAGGDMNAAELAVVENGFDGYLMRSFGNQGTAVLLGPRVVAAEHVGGKAEANTRAEVPPSPAIPSAKLAAISLIKDTTLPSGQLTPSRWAQLLPPDVRSVVDLSALNPDGYYYKSDIANLLWQGNRFYSQLYVAVTQMPAKVSGTAASNVKAWLMSNAAKMQVKEDELKWSGVLDYLDGLGKQKVAAADVTAYLDQGGVRVTEVVLDEGDVVGAEDIKDGFVKGHYTVVDDLESTWSNMYAIIDTDTDEIVDKTEGKEATAYRLNELTETGSRTKFEGYVLPGGENYRELLLTLPKTDIGSPAFEAMRNEYLAIQSRAYEDGQRDMTPVETARMNELRGAMEATSPVKRAEFRSSHFDQPNILAHIRFNERTDADGKRVLFVEEIQSDWGQKGKKEGFVADGKLPTGWKVEQVKVSKYSDAMEWAVFDNSNTQVGLYGKTKEEAIASALNPKGFTSGTPSAPFVTDTKSWTSLALKRAIIYAVDNGFDRIAWTTGEQQAARYDLSKQVDELVAYDDNTLVARKDGLTMIERSFKDESELADIIGKDAAAKLMAAQPDMNNQRVLSGQDLKLGGEGMKGFYDQIVPQVAKKLGAKLATVEFGKTDQQKRWDAEGAEYSAAIQQPGFDITEAMRAQISERGMPLFAGEAGPVNRGAFNPKTLDITLLAEANLTTFAHELGHFFMTAYFDIASQPNAPADITGDVNALLAMFGVKDLATWNAMTLEQQRVYHETFAESWEQYLFTGKAPTAELKSLFRKFSDWMKSVYGSIKNFLASPAGQNAKLNPELAAVMDRMVATEEEIKAASEQRAFTQMFKDAVEAGMTEQQFADYLALNEDQRAAAEETLRARSLRDMKWLQTRRNEFIAALQRDAKEKRKAMLAEVSKEVAATPLRQAMRWLKNGEALDSEGNEITVVAGNKLKISEVESLYPAGVIEGAPNWKKLGYGKYGMLAEEGLHPDMVADMFGFPSGQDLIARILEAPKFKDEVEALTDQRMLEAYGDLNSPEAMDRAADEAIHNDARTRMIATELATLRTNIGSPAVLIKAAKEYAKQMLAQKTSKTLKPWQFAAAEARAGRAALNALRKGDRAEAAKQKRLELINHVATLEAYKVEKEVKKTVDTLKKIVSYKDDSSAVKGREMAIVQAVRAVLAEYGIGTKGKAAAEYLDLVRANDPVAAEELDALIEAARENARPWNELKIETLRALAEGIDSLWSLAQYAKNVEVDGKRRSIASIQEELLAKQLENPVPEPLGVKQALTKKDMRKQKFARLIARAKRPETWFSVKDGSDRYGPWRRYVWNLINRAQDSYDRERTVRLRELAAAFQPIMTDMKRSIKVAAPEIGYTFGGDNVLGYAELLHAVLHTGNDSNKRKLLLGRGWATEREDGTLDTSKWNAMVSRMFADGTLRKEHMDFAQAVWDLMDSLKPAAQKAHKAATGRYFTEVQPTPVATPFGTYRGGYVPALTDRNLNADADMRALMEAAQKDVISSFKAPGKGFTMKRTDYLSQLELNLQSLSRHINDVLLFSHMSSPVRDVQRILRSDTPLMQALSLQDKDAMRYVITPWLEAAATQTVAFSSSQGLESWAGFRMIRSNAGIALMFGNVINVLQQTTAVFPAMLKVRSGYLGSSLKNYLTSPKDVAAHVASMSPYMAERISNDVHAAAEQIDAILLDPGVYDKLQNLAKRYGYFLQIAMDSAMGPVLWMAKYNEVMESGAATTEDEIVALERKAIDLADSLIRTTQGSNRAIDIASMEKGSPFYRMFVQFAGFFSAQANLIWEEMSAVQKSTPAQQRRRLAAVAVLGVVAPAILSQMVANIMRGSGDDDKDGEWIDDWMTSLFSGTVKYTTAMIPVAGLLINAAFDAFDDKPYNDRVSMAPAVSLLEGGVRGVTNVAKSLFGDKELNVGRAIRDIGTLVSVTTGIPVTPATKAAGYAADVATGKVTPTSPIDAVRGTITGAASPASK